MNTFLTQEMLEFVSECSKHSSGGYFKHKLIFAVLLKFYESEGRPLTNKDLIPADSVGVLSQQLSVLVK
tara:strand:- start:131 stop:337 length:207 start_codon:yes stop_codon:yes gene_type:complete